MNEEEKISLAKAVANRMLGEHGLHFKHYFVPCYPHWFLLKNITLFTPIEDDIQVKDHAHDTEGNIWQVQCINNTGLTKEIIIFKIYKNEKHDCI